MGNVVSARSCDEAWEVKEKRDNFIFVSHEISSDWTWLARELNLSDADIKGIDADYEKQGAREKAYQALVKWFEENGRNGATKEVLCEALHAINKKAIAERICCSGMCDIELTSTADLYSIILSDINMPERPELSGFATQQTV